jgi:hypothetical protein
MKKPNNHYQYLGHYGRKENLAKGHVSTKMIPVSDGQPSQPNPGPASLGARQIRMPKVK